MLACRQQRIPDTSKRLGRFTIITIAAGCLLAATSSVAQAEGSGGEEAEPDDGPRIALEIQSPHDSEDSDSPDTMTRSSTNPANCVLSPQDAHPSSNEVVFKLTKACAYNVNGWWQIWGDRSSWSGWRLFHGRFDEPTAFKSKTWRIAKKCLDGTYDYRTRGKSESYIGGQVYAAEVWGTARSIKSNSSNTNCLWA